MSAESYENPFAGVMAGQPSSQLLKVIDDKERYRCEARIAAIEELVKRQEATPELLDKQEQILEEERQKRLAPPMDESEESIGEGIAPGFTGNLFKITDNYVFTPLILYANLLVFIIMAIAGVNIMQPSIEDLVVWGGNARVVTLDGGLWRLFTSMFVHGGIIHLVFNMYALIQIGFILETNMGKYRYLIAYIACGILASVASLAVHDNIISVGASGAIFGLDGVLLALLITKVLDISPQWRQRLIGSTVIFIGYNLVFGFARAGIDNAAHIGGLISGFLIGLAYTPSLKGSQRSMVISGIIGVVVLAVLLTAPNFIPDKVGEYRRAMQRYDANEKKGRWMFQEQVPIFMQREKSSAYANRLQTEGIDIWKENLTILNSLTDLPDVLQKRVDLLKKYSDVRLRECEVLKRTINDFRTRDKEIGELETELVPIIRDLNKPVE